MVLIKKPRPYVLNRDLKSRIKKIYNLLFRVLCLRCKRIRELILPNSTFVLIFCLKS